MCPSGVLVTRRRLIKTAKEERGTSEGAVNATPSSLYGRSRSTKHKHTLMMRRLIAALLVGASRATRRRARAAPRPLLLAVPRGHVRQQQVLADLQPHGRPPSASQYSIAYCVNGCSTAGTFEYGQAPFANGASIAAGGTYTVCNSRLTNRAGCNEEHGFPSATLQRRRLCCSHQPPIAHQRGRATNIVDQIGLFSTTDPGLAWPVCGTGSGLDTRNGSC